jgi:hypothetical protein
MRVEACALQTGALRTGASQTCGLNTGRDADSATKAKPRDILTFSPSMIFSENRLPHFRNHARMIVAERRCPLSGNALKGGGP